jgi:hypothetical protein
MSALIVTSEPIGEQNERYCVTCGEPLAQRQNESNWHFAKRRACDKSCAAKERQQRRGTSPIAERLWRRVDRGEPNDCWTWTGAKTKNGYGVIGRSGRGAGNALTHRVALELETGKKIPENRDVDHLCRNRLCCNPAHLEVVTRGENMRRGYRVVLNLLEREWQQQVVDTATLYGWRHFHAYDMRRSDPGWPDLVLCRPPEVLVVELKSSTGRLSAPQKEWLSALSGCGLETAVWRPEDFDAVHARLRRRP